MVDMGILVNVLIILSLVMLVASSLFESTVLQIKMTDRFKRHSEEWMEAEKALTALEEKIEKTGECVMPHCSLIEFVPDELFEIECSGVSYYEVRNKIYSTFAVRRQGQSIIFEDPKWGDLSELPPDSVIGSDPQHRGVRLYAVLPQGLENNNVLSAFQKEASGALKLVYTIDEKTTFGLPRLWHEVILIEKIREKKLAIYRASTGKKIQEVKLTQESLASDYPLCGSRPVVLIRQPRERKRKIIVAKDRERWFAEVDLDFDLLGRRTETVGFASAKPTED